MKGLASPVRCGGGFTLLELLIAIGVASLLVAVAVPSASKMYQSMAYRGAVKETRHMLEAARYRAMSTGKSSDVVIDIEAKTITLPGSKTISVPEDVKMGMVGAAELQEERRKGAIRFYADGSSTGGSIALTRKSGSGTELQVGWLLGEISQRSI